MNLRLALMAIAMITLPLVAAGEKTWIRTDRLDVRLGRIYLPLGEEVQVYRYSSITVFLDDDTLLTTHAEHAWNGISVSAPVSLRADTLDLTRLSAVVEMAEIDEGAVMRIGTDLTGLEILSPDRPLDRVEIIEYDDPLVMEDDLQADLIDGVVSFRDLTSSPAEIVTQAYPVPYLAVMIPNIGRDWNQRGQLTTSLYYRFDADHLALGFDGDRVRSTHRFRSRQSDDGTTPFRLYMYDPERGRRLFQALDPRPPSLAISSNNEALSGIVHFFADVIARDRCPVSIVESSRAADLRIEFVPLQYSLPSATIYSLFYHLTTDSLPGRLPSEDVRQIDAVLKRVETPASTEEYYRQLDIAGRIMMEELGVFPLFRPTLFLHAHKRLQGVTADLDGFLDFSRAALIKLPQPPEETE